MFSLTSLIASAEALARAICALASRSEDSSLPSASRIDALLFPSASSTNAFLVPSAFVSIALRSRSALV